MRGLSWVWAALFDIVMLMEGGDSRSGWSRFDLGALLSDRV